MMLLAADTSTTQVTVSVGDAERLWGGMVLARPRHHAELLVPALDHLLTALDIRIADVTGVAVTTGPGLFAGLRVGIATMAGVAQVGELPMYGLSSLEVLADAAPVIDGTIAATIDARRGELYWARFARLDGRLVRLSADAVDPPATVARAAVNDVVVGHGVDVSQRAETGSHRAGRQLDTGLTPEALWRVSVRAAQTSSGVSAQEIEPVYLRKTDAELNWERRRSLEPT
ncbi:MAG: tRNA (adenosine(37)-N6)-threonylcarbamoyltransferase complex dimerization subunit type 1 TsaB [Actinobacteria bacterium]|nr:tRNA (adenosine(37)-N6)-threonylcarbamoyltransferase complex dimerization subunit type 1 TsaB [Actinomycetota bacterium]